MQVIPFWGCMIPLKYPQMERAVRFTMQNLNVELVDDERFSCCPDPIYFKAGDKMIWYTLAARNIALAEEHELDMITMCSGCTSTLCEVNHHLKHDEKLRDQVNEKLKAVGLQYRGSINVKHIVSLLRDDMGMEAIRQSITRPLHDVGVAIHYGCHLLKPSEIMQVEDPIVPKILYDLFQVTGATPIDHREYLLCCGKASQEADIGLNMSHAVFNSVKSSGADCLGLICPTCFDSFDIGQLRVSRKFEEKIEIPVVYYFQLLAIAQGASVGDVGLSYHKIMPAAFQDKLQHLDTIEAAQG